MQAISLAIIVIGGGWLIAVGLLMAARPTYCSRLFTGLSAQLEAAERRVDLTEQMLRLIAGTALILRSPASKMPLLLLIFGSMLVVSSLVILALPIRLHGAFGRFWAQRLTPTAIRLLSFLPLVAGPALVYVAI